MNPFDDAPDTRPRRQRPARGVSGQRIRHDSAEKHVTGQAIYTDDIPELANTLYAAVGQSQEAHARITAMDLSPVKAAAGVVAVVTLDDIPGEQDIGPVIPVTLCLLTVLWNMSASHCSRWLPPALKRLVRPPCSPMWTMHHCQPY